MNTDDAMTRLAPTVRPVGEISRRAALMSMAAASLALVLLAALHVVEPEFDPSWRLVSEYANGRYGWIMGLTFIALALSCAGLFVAVHSQIQTMGGRVGLAVLLAVIAAMTAAAMFPMDPITSSRDAATMHGSLHGVASMIGIPGFPIAAMLISWSLSRNPAWSSSRRWLLGTASLMWVSLLLMLLVLAVALPRSAGFGPDVPVGWPNRLMVASYGVWLLTVSRLALQRSGAAH